MENYNETSGNNRNDRNNGSIRQNNQENLTQNNKNNLQQEQQEQGKKPVHIKDMPEIKPEVNQGGI